LEQKIFSTKEAALAARKVIVVVEEMVSRKVIRRDPNRTLLPGFLVHAVIPEPWGAHPSPIPGYYNRDHGHYIRYHNESREREGYLKWRDRWVLGVKDRKEYLGLLSEEEVKSLLVNGSLPERRSEFCLPARPTYACRSAGFA
jgi:glutaconate CoA-transferase subunit A